MASLMRFRTALSNNDLQGIKDNMSATPTNLGFYLSYPAKFGRLDIVKFFVNNGAIVNCDALSLSLIHI